MESELNRNMSSEIGINTQKMVTIFKSFGETSAGYDRPIDQILERFRVGRSKSIVDSIRRSEPGMAKQLKKTLPAILFSGTFKQRNAASIVKHSGFICLDFDGYETNEALMTAREQLRDDAYTYSCFISPSGAGLKVLVKIPEDIPNHKGYFDSLREYYNDPHFDIHCSDICRICFESYDPDIYINQDSLLYDNLIEPDLYESETPNIVIPIRSDNQIIDNLMTWFNKRYGMNSGQRNSNLYKLAAALNDYGIQPNEAERVCSQFIAKDFTKREVEDTIKSAYRRRPESFGTKFFEDAFTKKKIEQQIIAGKDVKAIRRAFPELTEDQIDSAVETVKENISVTDFWQFSEKGVIHILHHKFKYFLQERNYFKYYPSGANGFIFISIHENLIQETNKDQIKDFVLTYLLGNEKIGIKPFNFMAEKTKYFTYDYLSFLETKSVELLEDTQDSSYLYYSNKVVKVTEKSIQEIDYLDSTGYIWKNQIIDRPFIKANSEGAVFSKLLFYIANQEEGRYNSLKSVIGYLLHSFKTSANNKAIIFNDETISDTPNGGSGKGLFWNAISHMKKVNSLDGKTFSFGDQFKYQTVSTDCQILVFDDVKNNFDFESLFSLITEGITLERKGQLAIKLPVKKSPKILITTNYTVGGVGGSFDRRKFEVEFSSFFNANNTPLSVFGHLLFDEWSTDEWVKFDNFMIECLQYYFANGLVQSEFKNLEVRKFISKTSSEFYEFTTDTDNMPLNTRIYSDKFFEAITNEYPDLRKWLTHRRLKMWVENYGIHNGYKIYSGRDQIGRYFEVIAKGQTQPKQQSTDYLQNAEKETIFN